MIDIINEKREREAMTPLITLSLRVNARVTRKNDKPPKAANVVRSTIDAPAVYRASLLLSKLKLRTKNLY